MTKTKTRPTKAKVAPKKKATKAKAKTAPPKLSQPRPVRAIKPPPEETVEKPPEEAREEAEPKSPASQPKVQQLMGSMMRQTERGPEGALVGLFQIEQECLQILAIDSSGANEDFAPYRDIAGFCDAVKKAHIDLVKRLNKPTG